MAMVAGMVVVLLMLMVLAMGAEVKAPGIRRR